ncbi:hypothetical protein [Castellaniella sp.]|uniref:hypothetical protein n=1 Tax=Castellaniella sp. TaxID=1955812 RepID=UPI003C77C39A
MVLSSLATAAWGAIEAAKGLTDQTASTAKPVDNFVEKEKIKVPTPVPKERQDLSKQQYF